MLGNPYVEMLGSISLIMAIIVGYAVMLFIVLAAFIYPVAKLGRKLVRKLLRIKSPSTDPFPPFNPLFEAFDGVVTLNDRRAMAALDEPTNMFKVPENMRNEMAARIDSEIIRRMYEGRNETTQELPGLMYLAGRPIEANSEDTQFMDKITTMHHQI